MIKISEDDNNTLRAIIKQYNNINYFFAAFPYKPRENRDWEMSKALEVPHQLLTIRFDIFKTPQINY